MRAGSLAVTMMVRVRAGVVAIADAAHLSWTDGDIQVYHEVMSLWGGRWSAHRQLRRSATLRTRRGPPAPPTSIYRVGMLVCLPLGRPSMSRG